jgi:hypothetical protein
MPEPVTPVTVTEISLVDPRVRGLPGLPQPAPTPAPVPEAPLVASSTPPASGLASPSARSSTEPSAPPAGAAPDWLGMRTHEDRTPATPETPVVPAGPRGPDLRIRPGLPGPPPPDAARPDVIGNPYAGTVLTPNLPGAGVGEWHEDLGRPTGGGTYRAERRTFKADVAEDGSVRLRDKPNWQGGFFADPKEGVGYRATFDVTDWLMRMHGEDPYLYNKMKWLEDTREERQQMALAYRARSLRESVYKLPDLLSRVWYDEALSPVERRRAIFLLWDECAEKGDPEVLAASREVRATIVGFVRRVAPRGSAGAYGAEELEKLNAERESEALFDPYEAEE